MLDKNTLTVAEIAVALRVLFLVEKRAQERTIEVLALASGTPVPKIEPEIELIQAKVFEHLASVLAERLERGDYTVPPLTSDVFAAIMNDAEQDRPGRLGYEESEVFKKAIAQIYTGVTQALEEEGETVCGVHEVYWKKIEILLDTARDYCGPVRALPAIHDVYERLVRGMFDKDKFVSFHLRKIEKMMTVESYKRLCFGPLMDMLAEGNEDDRRELEELFNFSLFPQIEALIETHKPILIAFVRSEAERIFK